MVDNMTFLILFALFCFNTEVLALNSNVPVLIWNHDRLPSLSVPLAGHTVSEEAFSKDYLEKLLQGEDHNLLVFLQNKLSLDDISRHGDVYSDDSDGAALHNIKHLMETYSSLHLPSVSSPAAALDKSKSLASKKVTTISRHPYTLKSVPLNENGGNAVLVHLPEGENTEESLQNIDGIIGAMSDEMKDLGKPFTTIYTGKKSSVQPINKMYVGRHLLAEESAGGLLNITNCIYLWAGNITFSIKTQGKQTNNSSWDFTTSSFNTDGSECSKNSTIGKLVMELKDAEKPKDLQSLKITFAFEGKRGGWWGIAKNETKIDYNAGTKDEEGLLVADFIQAPLGLSYHCWQAPPMTGANNESGAVLTIQDLQVQVFQIKGDKFGLANDCVGFFTIPIWAGIITMLLLTAILGFGLIMLMNINTMDRFDDPKGKTITVNVAE